MKNLGKFSAIVALAFLFVIPIVQAGTVITMVDAVNANGSIGLYLRNELGVTIFTDNTKNDRNVLTFTVNGSNISINSDKSDSEVPKGLTKFIVLNKAWPAGGYYTVDITYRDAGGGYYPKDTYTLFAKPPLSLASYSISPSRVLSNQTRVMYTAKISGSGEASVSNINFQLLANPKYYLMSNSKIPGALSAGATADLELTFDKDSQTFPDTVIYTTVYVPMQFTYKSMGFEGTQTFNTSFVIFNSATSVSQSPKMNARIAVPESAEPGQKVAIPVYAWNSNVGGNPACNANLTLTSDSSDLSIPINKIAPGGEFKGRVEETADPTATFTVEVSPSTKSGSYKLTMTVDYQDCTWKSTDFFVKSETLAVKKAGEVVEPLPKTIIEENKTTKEPIVNITAAPQEPKGLPSVFVTALAIVGIIVIFGLVYFLELRSRTVF